MLLRYITDLRTCWCFRQNGLELRTVDHVPSYLYCMAGNIGIELYFAVGKFKLGLINFDPPTLFKKSRLLNLLKRGFFNSTFLNTMSFYEFLKIEKCQLLNQKTSAYPTYEYFVTYWWRAESDKWLCRTLCKPRGRLSDTCTQSC